MRQINLKILRSRLTQELNNLPFEITRNGKVVGIVSKGLNLSEEAPKKKAKGLNNPSWINPLSDTVRAPKK